MPRVSAGHRLRPVSQPSRLSELLEPVANEIPTWKAHAQEQARKGEICPVCHGLRVTRRDVPIQHPEFGKLSPCPACSEGRISEYLKANSGLEGWLKHARPDDYIHTDERSPQFQAVMKIMKQGHGWLTLWGTFGVSKTFLLACVINEYIRDRRQSVYVTAGAMLDHLRDAYGNNGPGYSWAFDQWSTCYALAIDEVTAYQSTDWAQDKFRQLLNRRYALAKESVTLFASNIEPASAGWPGELGWLASRLSEFPIVEARGGDVRPLLEEEEYE